MPTLAERLRDSSLLYLLDANVMITANNTYMALDRVPEFWDWILHMGASGYLKMPLENLEEITKGSVNLADWLGDHERKAALCLDESVDIGLLQHCIAAGYASDLDDAEIVKVGNDPFLIAYALVDAANRTVVTTEVSKPKRQRANRHVPDVCDSLHAQWIDSIALLRALDFSTGWRGKV